MNIKIIPNDALEKPLGQVLIIPHLVGADSLYKNVDQKLAGRLSKRAKEISYNLEKKESFIVWGIGDKGGFDAYLVMGLGKKSDFKLTDFQKQFAKTIVRAGVEKFKSAALDIKDIVTDDYFTLGKFISEALHLSQYRFDKYKSDEERKKIVRVEELNIYIDKSKFQNPNVKSNLKSKVQKLEEGIRFGEIVSQGVYLTRDLVNEPAMHMHPDSLVIEAQKIVKESGGKISVKVLEEGECRKFGMGAFLSVAAGSHKKPKFIILKYSRLEVGSEKMDKEVGSGKRICLIGKSITFDSGGLSLKPSKGMETMKIDMAGGATVLGVFHILSHPAFAKAMVGKEIYGILPACENMPGGAATRPGDIVRALNGKTIEVLNTDAEGRMALADALSYAEKFIKPDYIIDIATLTGAIMVALGEDITGVFGNDEKFNTAFMKSSQFEGEEAWLMPLHADYLKLMKSDIADLKNVSGRGYGGAITAAVFLKEFVKKAKWIHLDIAGSSFNEGRPQPLIPKGATAWGVRSLVSWLQSL